MSNTENNEFKDDLEYIDLNDTPSDDQDSEAETQEPKSASSKMIHILFGAVIAVIITPFPTSSILGIETIIFATTTGLTPYKSSPKTKKTQENTCIIKEFVI